MNSAEVIEEGTTVEQRRRRFYYQWNKENGICVSCGARPRLDELVRCGQCHYRMLEGGKCRN